MQVETVLHVQDCEEDWTTWGCSWVVGDSPCTVVVLDALQSFQWVHQYGADL